MNSERMLRKLELVFIFLFIVFLHCYAEDDSSCGPNSSPDICGTMCEPSCNNPRPILCPSIECGNTTTGICRCNNGYLRDSNNGMCVSYELCTNCPPGEALLACGSICEGTCQDPHEPEICSRIRCFIPSCGCDLSRGYVRESLTNSCIKIEDCAHVE